MAMNMSWAGVARAVETSGPLYELLIANQSIFGGNNTSTELPVRHL
jgi:hypothetical protein